MTSVAPQTFLCRLFGHSPHCRKCREKQRGTEQQPLLEKSAASDRYGCHRSTTPHPAWDREGPLADTEHLMQARTEQTPFRDVCVAAVFRLLDMPWEVQLSVIYATCDLAPSNPEAALNTLESWMKNNTRFPSRHQMHYANRLPLSSD
ncbi:hypothetical protein HF521_021948 [Silurus meridionalis]|uniref:Little elongation complex subunit 1 C-terminal domain-containing protein n=1 Tax=Silurus meridionalis TaxID=175797 RepID=A0A8T0BH84_SILME|nr:hypothetical protein HF521_021948 [Silurus meridionalis]